MELLLDEQLAGSKKYYEALGWIVRTVQDVEMAGYEDLKVAKFAQDNNMFLITNDVGMSEVASLMGLRHFLISNIWIAKLADAEIRKMLD